MTRTLAVVAALFAVLLLLGVSRVSIRSPGSDDGATRSPLQQAPQPLRGTPTARVSRG